VTGDDAGHRVAWRDLFAVQYPRLGGWVRRLVDDEDAAHEIASEAFVRLMSRWTHAEHPEAYLYKVAANLVRDHWRRSAKERRAVRLAVAGQRHDSGAGVDHAIELRALLESLPEHQRTAVMLHYLAGFPIHEVSLVLGRPEGTVKSDLYQARKRLRSAWEATHD
jgi:RNA polymerase sigma-70 factor (ECF subfamily)